jgi:hypothetical protein
LDGIYQHTLRNRAAPLAAAQFKQELIYTALPLAPIFEVLPFFRKCKGFFRTFVRYFLRTGAPALRRQLVFLSLP